MNRVRQDALPGINKQLDGIVRDQYERARENVQRIRLLGEAGLAAHTRTEIGLLELERIRAANIVFGTTDWLVKRRLMKRSEVA